MHRCDTACSHLCLHACVPTCRRVEIELAGASTFTLHMPHSGGYKHLLYLYRAGPKPDGAAAAAAAAPAGFGRPPHPGSFSCRFPQASTRYMMRCTAATRTPHQRNVRSRAAGAVLNTFRMAPVPNQLDPMPPLSKL